MTTTLRSIFRHPVKSMGGEELSHVELDERGIVGDRWYAVEDGDGHFASGKNTRRFRRRDAVFGFTAATVGEGVRVSDGTHEWAVGDAALDAHLSELMGDPVRVLPERDVLHQDGGQVSLIGTATLAWCAERWGVDADPRRLRVNLVVETDEPFVEESWVGSNVSVGDVVLHVDARVPRCRMIDIQQVGVRADGAWLKPLGGERDACLAVYASVVSTGTLHAGAPVSPTPA
ncbi:MOSC domain-containing protein [Mariniluteicoccus endophyticus]